MNFSLFFLHKINKIFQGKVVTFQHISTVTSHIPKERNNTPTYV